MATEKYSTVSVRLTEIEKEALAAKAKELDLTMSQIIRKALKEYLNKE